MTSPPAPIGSITNIEEFAKRYPLYPRATAQLFQVHLYFTVLKGWQDVRLVDIESIQSYVLCGQDTKGTLEFVLPSTPSTCWTLSRLRSVFATLNSTGQRVDSILLAVKDPDSTFTISRVYPTLVCHKLHAKSSTVVSGDASAMVAERASPAEAAAASTTAETKETKKESNSKKRPRSDSAAESAEAVAAVAAGVPGDAEPDPLSGIVSLPQRKRVRRDREASKARRAKAGAGSSDQQPEAAAPSES